MLKWISSMISPKDAIVEANGTLIEFNGQTPITVIIDAVAVIDKSKSPGQFEHTLVVNDNDEEETFYQWVLDESRQFSNVSNKEGAMAFAWRDDEDFNTWFIFRLTDANDEKGPLLQKLASMCIYENMYETSAAKLDISKVEEEVCGEVEFGFNLITMELLPVTPAPSSPASSPRPSTSTPTSSEKVYPDVPNPIQSMSPKFFDDEEEFSRATVDLFLLDPHTNVFNARSTGVDITLIHVGDSKSFTYFVNIELGDQRIFQQEVGSMHNVQWFNEQNSIIWTLYLGRSITTWSVVFKDLEDKEHFKETLTMALYEVSNKLPWNKVKQEDRIMLTNSRRVDSMVVDDDDYSDDDLMAFDDDVDMEGPHPEDDDDDEEEYSDDDEEEEENVPRSSKGKSSTASPSREKNRFLVDSARHERTFVVRGNNIGVFKRDHDDVTYENAIMSLRNFKGDDLMPASMMLHKGDNELLLLHDDQNDKTHRGRVYQLDIEKQKIVQEWTAFDDLVPVMNTAPIYKYANMDDTQLFSVLNKNAIFGMDPRLSEKNKVIGNYNSFVHSSNPDFSCVSTSKHGFVAIGSNKGEIRLLSGVPGTEKLHGRGTNPKSAKTLLPGFGDPIKGIDVTSDGHYVLATCKDYLIVVNTQMPDNPNKTGFTERMGAKKPSPSRLQLLPEDLLLFGEKGVNFSPAQFNTGSDGEMWIVTSSGPYIFTWNFNRVKKGSLSDYTKKRLENHVVDESFLNMGDIAPGRDAPIVVAMPDDVKLEKRKRVEKVPYRRMPSRYK